MILFEKPVLLEFGSAGGECSSIEVVSAKEGARLAANIVRVFSSHIDKGRAAAPGYWDLSKATPRAIWFSHKHYVALTRLDYVGKLPPLRTIVGWP